MKGRVLPAVDHIQFTIKEGECVGLVGESGSGKSVTAKSILGLLSGTSAQVSGNIQWGERNLLTLNPEELRKVRGHEIGMIFQEPMTALNPVMSVFHQVAEVLTTHSHEYSKDKVKELVFSTFERVELDFKDEAYRLYPHELSGGMRQRVMIAMSIIGNPKLLIADEPTTALDVTVQAQILDLLRSLQKERKMAILLISHDLGVISEMSETVYLMYAGKIVEEGPTNQVLKERLHPYTEGLYRSLPTLGEKKDRLISMTGSLPPLDALPKGCHFSDRCPKRVPRCVESEPPLVKKHSGYPVRCFEVN